MPKFAANLSFLFTELAFLDRFKAARDAGFRAVEFMFPYDYEKEELSKQLHDNELAIILHNLPAGNWAAGERGIACHPDRIKEFRQGVELGVQYAKALGVHQLNCLAGIPPAHATFEQAREAAVTNLAFAAQRLGDAGIKLLIEPVNTIDVPGFFVSTSKFGLELIDAAGTGNIGLQYDVYHMQVMEGNLARTIESNLSRFSYIQVADNPGRHEPGTGEINYPFLFGFIDRIGYASWIGCEYKPSKDTVSSLDWLKGQTK
jgi:hydroxypyruvate isomerase